MSLAQDKSLDYICRNLLAGGENSLIALDSAVINNRGINRFHRETTDARMCFPFILGIPFVRESRMITCCSVITKHLRGARIIIFSQILHV